MIIGARELRATTVTPAKRGPPRVKYLSFLINVNSETVTKIGLVTTYVAVAPTYEMDPTAPIV